MVWIKVLIIIALIFLSLSIYSYIEQPKIFSLEYSPTIGETLNRIFIIKNKRVFIYQEAITDGVRYFIEIPIQDKYLRTIK